MMLPSCGRLGPVLVLRTFHNHFKLKKKNKKTRTSIITAVQDFLEKYYFFSLLYDLRKNQF